MVRNPKQREEDRLTYLGSLYAICEDYQKLNPDFHDFTNFSESEQVIAARSGMSPGRAESVLEELINSDLILPKPGGVGGWQCTLTSNGLDVIERHLFEKSAEGKREKLKSAVKKKATEAAGKGFDKLATFAGGAFFGWLGANWRPAWTWCRSLFGM